MPSADIRDSVLDALKREGELAIQELADRLGVTYEAVRQHMIQFERDGMVERRVLRPSEKPIGRPNAVYALTLAGDRLFAKRYDELASLLLASLGDLSDDARRAVLAAITDWRVAQMEPLVRGRTLDRRVELLRGLYAERDPYMSGGVDEEGGWLAEANCPYLDVAMRHPVICSTTVSALARLVGCRVVRTERFQDGDRRCLFRIVVDEPITAIAGGFEEEPRRPG